MNWMTASLMRWLWSTLALGAFAGFWAAMLYHASQWIAGGGWPPFWAAAWSGAALGLGLCSGLAAVDDFINRFWRRSARAAAAGGLLGMAAGAVIFGLGESLLAPGEVPGAVRWIIVPLGLGILGLAAGAGSGLGAGRPQKAFRRGLWGLAAGIAFALPLTAVVSLAGGAAWPFQAALTTWGALVAGTVFWREKKFARRWMRVLTGPGEDNFYPLDTPLVTLGKMESNDIPLPHYQEIFPFHCQLHWDADHYKIMDKDQGGTVLVNFRHVHEQALKAGDLVKLGTALLQYGEAS